MATEITRKRMTDAEVEKFLAAYAKQHDLKGNELIKRLRHVAATRLAALARYTAKPAQKAPKKKAPKKKAQKGVK
jgi:hypothetical protein